MSDVLSKRTMDVVLLLNRLALGAYVGFAGLRKVIGELDRVGTFLRSDSYRDRQPAWLPDFIAVPYGYALPWLELGLALMVIVGILGRWTSLAMTLLLLTIAIALLDQRELLNVTGMRAHHILPMLTLSLLMSVTGAGRISVDGLIRGRK